jgi:hypothetical protein
MPFDYNVYHVLAIGTGRVRGLGKHGGPETGRLSLSLGRSGMMACPRPKFTLDVVI